MAGTRFNRNKRICNSKTTIVMSVNTNYSPVANAFNSSLYSLFTILKHTAALSFTKSQCFCSTFNSSFQRFQSIFRVSLVSGKEVLGIINNPASVFLKESASVFNHRKVFFKSSLDYISYLESPAFSKNYNIFCASSKQRLKIYVFRTFNILAASRAKSCKL